MNSPSVIPDKAKKRAPVRKQCVSDPKCTGKVIAKGRCDTHYHRYQRGMENEGAPIRSKQKGDLVPLSMRISSFAKKELDRGGGAYSKAAEVIEEWAAQQADARKKGSKARA